MNYDKSTVFFSSNTSKEMRYCVTQSLGVQESINAKRYLGLPNMISRRKKWAFQNIKDRLNNRVDSWQHRFLFQGGKEVFIKSILQAIPTYAMSCFATNIFL